MSVTEVEDERRLAQVTGAKTKMHATPEGEFDEVARLLSTVCRTPHSMVMLLDSQQQWFKASGALRMHEHGVAASLCERTVQNRDALVIPDAARDSILILSPELSGGPRIRFYAGIPLFGLDGQAQGVLCTIDFVPRVMTSEQEECLELLARQLRARLELREQRKVLEEAVREREKAVAGLQASEELFRVFMNASPFLSYIKDAAGRLLFYNSGFAQRFGISEYAWLGKSDDQLWARNVSGPMRKQDLDVMTGGRMVESEEKIRGIDGLVTSWRNFKFPCHDSQGNTLLAGVAVDITEEVARKAELERYQAEMQEANEQLRRLSVTDELTGLRNRRAFEERLVHEFSMARRRKRDLAVLLLDVDHFKRINDRWGHGTGDKVLRQLAAALRMTVRLPDMVARYGGEEFVVLLPESGVDAGLGCSGRLMERVANEPWENEPVTVSIGLAAITEDVVNGFDLVRRADEALYSAKRAGRNRVVVHSPAEA